MKRHASFRLTRRRQSAGRISASSEQSTGSAQNAGATMLVMGLVALLVSGVIGYWALYEPLEKMRRHAPSISYSMKGIACFSFLAVLSIGMIADGIFRLFYPERKHAAKPVRRGELPAGQKLIVFLFFLAALGSGIGLCLWFDHQMVKAGYERGRLAVKPASPPQPSFTLPDLSREAERALQKSTHERLEWPEKVQKDPGRTAK